LPRAVQYAFPHNSFPLGAVHEFLCPNFPSEAATSGFIAAILSSMMRQGRTTIWIGSGLTIFPPALKAFGIAPEHIIFIRPRKEKDLLWIVEEALKCSSPAAVVAELEQLDFTSSRRLQLAVENSQVTGFLVRRHPKNLATACIARWSIAPLPSIPMNSLPGVGIPAWKVDLLKVRNGRPGSWQLQWQDGRLRAIPVFTDIHVEPHKKAG
ncbi:MAG TPA: Error-prone repair protein ImuA, partial [Flavisolibacter sp.]